jgi:hypothetical protein
VVGLPGRHPVQILLAPDQDGPDDQRTHSAVEKHQQPAAPVEHLEAVDEDGPAEGGADGEERSQDEVDLPVAEEPQEVQGRQQHHEGGVERAGDQGKVDGKGGAEAVETAVPEGGEEEVGLHRDHHRQEEGAQREEGELAEGSVHEGEGQQQHAAVVEERAVGTDEARGGVAAGEDPEKEEGEELEPDEKGNHHRYYYTKPQKGYIYYLSSIA